MDTHVISWQGQSFEVPNQEAVMPEEREWYHMQALQFADPNDTQFYLAGELTIQEGLETLLENYKKT